MQAKLIKRINKAFSNIYAMGDSGLDYLDRHSAVDNALMEHFYNETLNTLSVAQLTQLANSLETVVSDAGFDLAL
jgi:hypothetical protein